MAYHRYEVSGFVLAVYDSGEYDAVVSTYTKELGLISAKATGFRRAIGKLKYHIQPMTSVELSLVRGKEYWRLIGARNGEHFWQKGKYSEEVKVLMSQLLTTVKRLVHGEESNEHLFQILNSVFSYIAKKDALTGFSKDELLTIEVVAVARILYALGYIAKTDAYGPLVSECECSDDIFFFADVHKDALLKDVNNAFSASNL